MIKREIINPDKTYKWGWSLCTYIDTNKYKWYWHLCIHGEKNEREKETQIKIKIKIQILTSLYGEYHSNGWAPGPPAPLGSAWRPQPVIWNIYVWFFYFSSAKVFGHHHHLMLKSIYHPALNLKSDIWNMKPCEILLFSWLGIRNEIFSGWFSPSLSISSTFVIFLHVLHDIEA